MKMANIPPDPYHYSVLSDYYNQLSLQEKLQTNNKYEKYLTHNLNPSPDSTYQLPNGHLISPSHYTPPNDVYAPHPSSYSIVHPKKKIRMAYDKEIADSTSKRGFVPYSSINRNNQGIRYASSSYPESSKTLPNTDGSQRAEDLCPQTKIVEEAEPHSDLPKLIPLYVEHPVPYPSPLTPCNSPGSSTHDFPSSPVEDIKPVPAHSDSGWSKSSYQADADSYNDKPQDLRVSFSERLKDVARDILTASSIPQLNCSEIPELVALNPEPQKDEKIPTAVGKHGIFDEVERRHSRESSSQSPTHQSYKHSSPKCDNSCSGCYNPSPSSSSTSKCSNSSPPPSSSKDSKWTGKQKGSNSRSQFERYEKSQSTSFGNIEDLKAYLRKPIIEWSYADVIFFLMEACKELHIHPNGVKFKRSDDGAVLLRMNPSDFEVLAPNHGQRLYDYFISFQTQHYMSSNNRNNLPHRYNSECSEDQGNYSNTEHAHSSHHEPYSSTNMYPHPYDNSEARSNTSDHYSPYPSSPRRSYPDESPASEYVPQGSQYNSEHNCSSSHSSEEMRQRKSYDLPSAAWKTFPPLHNYEDPLSDPDEFEDEPPPAEPPKKRGPGRPPKPESERKRRPKKTGRLWEFIRNLLLDPKTCPSLLRWEDAHTGVFRIVQSDAIANKWGMRKNNEKMNYEKLSRAMRYYYKAKIFEPVLGKRLVYKFGINAKGWRPLNPNNPNFQNF